jgi:hypothetical protein
MHIHGADTDAHALIRIRARILYARVRIKIIHTHTAYTFLQPRIYIHIKVQVGLLTHAYTQHAYTHTTDFCVLSCALTNFLLFSVTKMAIEREMEAEREKERVEIEAEETQGKHHVIVEAELLVECDGVSDDSGDEDSASAAETVVPNDDVKVIEVTEVKHGVSRNQESEEARRKKKARAIVNLTSCDYSVIKEACKRFGWRFTNSDKGWTIKWTDRYLLGGTLREMKLVRPQRINHFPAMCEIAFKCRLATNLNRMRKIAPDEYDFYPETWVLPEEMAAFTKVPNETTQHTRQKRPIHMTKETYLSELTCMSYVCVCVCVCV